MDIEMDQEVVWSRKCPCGKSFYQPNSYSNHVKTCPRFKGEVGNTLEAAKARYAQKKKSKKGKEAIESWYGDEDLDLDLDVAAGDPMRDIEHPSPPPEEVAPAPEPLGRGMRVRAPPKAYKDFLATSVIPFDIPMSGHAMESPPPESPPGEPSQIALPLTVEMRRTVLQRSTWKVSRENGFKLNKVYWTLEERPHNPDLFLRRSDLREDEDDRLATLSEAPNPPPGSSNPYHPFPNWSSYRLGEWFWSEGGDKSRESFQRLVNILCDDGFSTTEVKRTNWKQVDAALATSEFDDAFGNDESLWAEDGTSWKTSPITVSIPFNSTSERPGSKPFTIHNFRFRPLVPLIRAKLEDAQASDHFHVLPSELWWSRKGGEDKVRVYGDLYHSDGFLEAYRDVQLLPAENAEDQLPRYVVALMFASDETMLASFGNAKLWPGYLHFGNESKYERGRISLKLLEEVAYFQNMPDSFNDWYIQETGKNTVGEDVLRHVRRELFQAQWAALLDEEFLHAYEHGLVIDCPDKVRRRFYPHIMTYSADYPERVKVVGIRNMGDCPCPRCLVSFDSIPQMGTENDRRVRTSQKRIDDLKRREAVAKARQHVYKDNYAIGAAVVEELLKPTSLVVAQATQNAFSDKLSPFGFDLHGMSAVDVLHEVEIGVWKDLFIHLLRLLEAVGVGGTDILNHRFRLIPSFGRDTIRRFSHNVSAMKQLGARDFEDLLQCSIPAFEGLFPGEHNGRVQSLLFTMAHWHGLAKLRMHTDFSLGILDSWTSIFGDQCRAFIELTCSRFQTKELKREYEARKRREVSKTSKVKPQKEKNQPIAAAKFLPPDPTTTGAVASSSMNTTSDPSAVTPGLEGPIIPEIVAPSPALEDPKSRDGRKTRTWNISTPKFHALGDVVAFIKRFGTTDSYSTQWSERFHRVPKARYRRTNKKDVSRQLSQIQTRQARIKKLHAQLHPSKEEMDPSHPWVLPDSGDSKYFIGKSQNQPVNLSHFLSLNASDPATRGFLSQLKSHLFPRIIATLIQEVEANLEQYPPGTLSNLETAALREPSERDLDSTYFHSDTIYRHNVLKVPYVTYDCRQDSDTINPHTTRRDFMCLSAPKSEPDDMALEGNESPVDPPTQGPANGYYVYGRVIDIFHANVVYSGTGALDNRRRRFDFLWVRWFTSVSAEGGDPWASHRLDRVQLSPLTRSGSWGFVDPADVLRAAHVIPRFSLGLSYGENTLGPVENLGEQKKRGKKRKKGENRSDHEGNPRPKPILSRCAHEDRDWKEYYVNRFVDRDMVMRFHRGIAVGHSYSQEYLSAQPSAATEDARMTVDSPRMGNSPDLQSMRPEADSAQEDRSSSNESDEEPLSGVESQGVGYAEDMYESADDFYVSEPDSEEEPDFYL